MSLFMLSDSVEDEAEDIIEDDDEMEEDYEFSEDDDTEDE